MKRIRLTIDCVSPGSFRLIYVDACKEGVLSRLESARISGALTMCIDEAASGKPAFRKVSTRPRRRVRSFGGTIVALHPRRSLGRRTHLACPCLRVGHECRVPAQRRVSSSLVAALVYLDKTDMLCPERQGSSTRVSLIRRSEWKRRRAITGLMRITRSTRGQDPGTGVATAHLLASLTRHLQLGSAPEIPTLSVLDCASMKAEE